MSRAVFTKLWLDSDPGSDAVKENFAYTKGDDSTTVESVRLDKYAAAEPNYDDPAWKDWHRVKFDLLLGDARKARTGRGYTVHPDEDVNRDILRTAQHYLPFTVDSRGLPPEDVRDLCSHLYTKVERLANGDFCTVFLDNEAAMYLREQGTPIAVPNSYLKNETKRTNGDEENV